MNDEKFPRLNQDMADFEPKTARGGPPETRPMRPKRDKADSLKRLADMSTRVASLQTSRNEISVEMHRLDVETGRVISECVEDGTLEVGKSYPVRDGVVILFHNGGVINVIFSKLEK